MMKNTLDTNPVISACIFKNYKEKIKKYAQDSDSLMILTIYNEICDKLLKLHTAFLKLEKFSSIKGNLIKIPAIKDIKNVSEQVYNFIINYKKQNIAELLRKVLITIGILLIKINKLQRYPNNDEKKQEIIQIQRKVLSKKLPKLKENDLNHLYLMFNYTQNFASQIYFYTEDKKDYLNNNDKIEKILKDVKIKNFLDFS